MNEIEIILPRETLDRIILGAELHIPGPNNEFMIIISKEKDSSDD